MTDTLIFCHFENIQENIMQDSDNFCYKLIPKNTEILFMENNR